MPFMLLNMDVDYNSVPMIDQIMTINIEDVHLMGLFIWSWILVPTVLINFNWDIPTKQHPDLYYLIEFIDLTC